VIFKFLKQFLFLFLFKSVLVNFSSYSHSSSQIISVRISLKVLTVSHIMLFLNSRPMHFIDQNSFTHDH